MARQLDGLDDMINMGNVLSLTQPTSIFGWLKRDALGETDFIVSKYVNASPWNGYCLRVYNDLLSGYDGQNWQSGATPVTAAIWHAVGMTVSGGVLAVYLDGASDGSRSGDTPAMTSSENLYFGRDAGGNYSDETLGEIAFWNVLLNASEISALAKGVCPMMIRPTAVIGYFPLWGVASPEPDLSGNKYNGTVTGAILANHPPVGRYVPYRFRALPLVSAVEYINVTDSILLTDSQSTLAEWLIVSDSIGVTDAAYLQGEIQIDGVALPHVQRIRVAEPTVMSSKPVPGALPTRIYLGRQGRTVEIEGWTDSLSTLNWIKSLADGANHDIQLPTGARISVHVLEATPRRSAEGYTIRDYVIRAVERMD